MYRSSKQFKFSAKLSAKFYDEFYDEIYDELYDEFYDKSKFLILGGQKSEFSAERKFDFFVSV